MGFVTRSQQLRHIHTNLSMDKDGDDQTNSNASV